MKLSLSEIKKIVSAVDSSVASSGVEVSSFSWDSRDIDTKSCFIALKGKTHDAHEFIDKDLLQKTNIAIVSNKGIFNDYKDLACMVLVDDSLVALQKIANAWRKKIKAQVIAITGSNGKTSTKEFLATILSESYNCHYSQGSFNNHWGVPFSILKASEQAEVIVLEMGMSAPKEIHDLCVIAEPDYVGVTNVGTSHIGFFKNEEGIAKAKAEIYEFGKHKTAVYNLDNKYTKKMFDQFSGASKKMTVSVKDASADVFLTMKNSAEESMTLEGSIGGIKNSVVIEVFGYHHIYNIMMAAGLALASGMKPKNIWQGIKKCKTIWGRSEWRESSQGYKILFDAYNSNLESVEALVESVSGIDKEKWLVIGEMKELGEYSAVAHEKLGSIVANANFSGIWYLGNYFKEFKIGLGEFKKNIVNSSTYNESLAIEFQSMLNPNGIVLIKGSRALKLEKISDFLQE